MLKTLASIVTTLAVGGSVALSQQSSAAPTLAPTRVMEIIDGNLEPANYWYVQVGNSCEPSALNFVIGAVTGSRVKSSTIEGYATSKGYYSPSGGMSFPQGVDVLAHYGVTATTGAHSLTYLEESLRTGHRVVALVDANPIWATLGWVGSTDGSPAWHALVVDQINISLGLVYLTDSGPTNGQVETVSIDTFKQGWGAGGWQLIVA